MKKKARTKELPFKIRASVFFGWVLISLLGRSIRFSEVRADILDQYKNGFVIACWHGQQLIGFYYFRGRGYTILSSEHRDGDYSSSIMRRFGWRIVRGSSTRGAVRGLIKLLDNLKKGIPVVLTPDGPKGPIYHIEPGVIYLAQKTGAPVIPLAFAFSKAIYLRTWDKFVVPAPFSRCVVQYGAPIFINRRLDEKQLETEKSRLALALHKTNIQAQKAVAVWK